MSEKVTTLQRENQTAKQLGDDDLADVSHPDKCNDTVSEQSRHLQKDRSDRRLSSEDSSKWSMNDSDSMFIPPSAMVDLLKDDFLTPIAKSTQLQQETPSESKDHQPSSHENPRFNGDDFISPPEGAAVDNRKSNDLGSISPSDQAKVKSPDLGNAHASLSRGNPGDAVACEKQVEDQSSSERNQQLASNIAGGIISRLGEGTTDSRTDSAPCVTDGITALDWSRGHAVRSASGPAQVNSDIFSKILNRRSFSRFLGNILFTTPQISTAARVLQVSSLLVKFQLTILIFCS